MATTVSTQQQTSAGSKAVFRAEQTFDSKRMRHYLNGKVTVLHCHHYASLFTQLARDASSFGGPQLLAEASAETFYPVLRDYYRANKLTSVADRIAVAEQYFAFVGLGDVAFSFGTNSGSAVMTHSHVDEGWQKKWGQSAERVNFIGEGYIQAAWAAVFDRPNPRDLTVIETQSIVSGAASSRFALSW